MTSPSCIILFSGKRKSGKDYITEILQSKIGKENSQILRISEPIKKYWAEIQNLNFSELLSDSDYKEKYRLEMIKWSEEVRSKNYGYFCKAACGNGQKPIWIFSDIRRKTDLKWFSENYGDQIKTVRVVTDDQIRSQRGWKFVKDIDDAESECDLDDFNDWDFIFVNNGNNDEFEKCMESILKYVNSIEKCNL